MRLSTAFLFTLFISITCAQRFGSLGSVASNTFKSFTNRSSNVLPSLYSTTTTKTTTTPSSLSRDETSTSNSTDSKGLLDFLKPAKETVLNKTSSGVASVLGGSTIKDTIATAITQTDTCFGKVSGWDDPVLGNFTTTKDSPYCDSKCARNFFCCAPFKPEQADVKFVYSNDQQNGSFVTLKDTAFRDQLRRSNRPLAFVVHGWLNNYQFDSYFNETRDGLVNKGYDVIIVDWARANRLYLQSIANVRIVGAVVGQLIQSIDYADKSMCIGYSLGAHICGEAGKWLRERQITLSKCHGIDPAGPAFDGCGPEIRLDPTDCGVVTAIHTSGYKSPTSLLKEGLGTSEKTGHCDFWVNHGTYQPNCDNGTIAGMKLDLFTGKFGRYAQKVEYSLLCSHARSMHYLVAHVNDVCRFTGRQARNCGEGRECQVIRAKRSDEYDEDAPTTRRPNRWSNNPNFNDARPSGSSSVSSPGRFRPTSWNQGQRPPSSTESTNDYSSGGNNNFNRATSRPYTWNQGHSVQDTFTTRKPDSLLASGSNNVNTWKSTTVRPGDGNSVYSSTASYDNSHSNDDVSHDTAGSNNSNSGNHNDHINQNDNNGRGTTSRPYRDTSTTRPFDNDEYSTRRPSTSYQGTSERPFNSRSTPRPGYMQTSSSSSSSYSTERPSSSWNQGSDSNRPSDGNRERPFASGDNRPDNNQNQNQNTNRPSSSGNWNQGSGSNSNFDRPGGQSNRPNGSNQSTGNSFGNNGDSSNSRPNGNNNGNQGNHNQQGNNGVFGHTEPNRPGNNGGSMMLFPPDDQCTGNMNVDYYVITSGYEPFC